jgi:uncharacterized protein (DUF927 family)
MTGKKEKYSIGKFTISEMLRENRPCILAICMQTKRKLRSYQSQVFSSLTRKFHHQSQMKARRRLDVLRKREKPKRKTKNYT